MLGNTFLNVIINQLGWRPIFLEVGLFLEVGYGNTYYHHFDLLSYSSFVHVTSSKRKSNCGTRASL